jgi:hypothetical protein
MVEIISKIQQLLAETKFVDAQKEAEIQLWQFRGSESLELLELYFESLKAQGKPLPSDMLLLFLNKLLPIHVDKVFVWLECLNEKNIRDTQEIVLLKMKIAQIKGQTNELHNLISKYQVLRFENKTPSVPDDVRNLIKKYFPHDFQLMLQDFALDLMKMDIASSELKISELILSCFEKSSSRGAKEKIDSLIKVLGGEDKIYHLIFYKNLCQILNDEGEDKKDLKKIIELIIYIEDFRLQVVILHVLDKRGYQEIAENYAKEIKKHRHYSFVYFEKHFSHLKKFFHKKLDTAKVNLVPASEKIDWDVLPFESSVASAADVIDVSEEESILAHVLKHQDFSAQELLDIAVSFLQSEFFYAGLEASNLAYRASSNRELRLKASYLKIIFLFKRGDNRAALDTSHEALNLAETQNDLLSILYSQAEALLRLDEKNLAKVTLRKIMNIDPAYRFTKEMLERLNAI